MDITRISTKFLTPNLSVMKVVETVHVNIPGTPCNLHRTTVV